VDYYTRKLNTFLEMLRKYSLFSDIDKWIAITWVMELKIRRVYYVGHT